MRRLENKVAIVTGAGRGIGEATARLMAPEGASARLSVYMASTKFADCGKGGA